MTKSAEEGGMTNNLGITLEEKRKKTELVLGNVYNIPAMAGPVSEILKMLDKPTTNNQTLSALISKDQAIATKVLSIANSPLYGLRRRVSTIDFAIMVIGFIEMKNIVMALSLMESFKIKTDKNLDQKDFWLHSLLTGSAAKRIAKDLNYHSEGTAFVAGLLHDLAIPIIHKYFHTSFIDIITDVKNNGKTFNEAELNCLGYNHQEIGDMLCAKWNLPSVLCDSIRHHHNPQDAKIDKTLVAIVHLADYLTQRLQIGQFYWDDNYIFDAEILKILDIGSEEELEKMTQGYKELFAEELHSLKSFV